MSDTSVPASSEHRAIPRPSDLAPRSTAPRFGWAAPLSWVLLVVAAVVNVGYALLGRSSIPGALLVLFMLGASRPILARLARTRHNVDLESLLRIGLALKFLAVIPRYELRQDAVDYHLVGRALVNNFRDFDFFIDPGRAIPGTGTVRYFTGLLHLFTFSDEFSTFAIFAALGFGGIALYVRAFVHALPHIDPGRYVVLLVFWPSLAYWPSSTGKEALVTFGLGMFAYGLARLLRGRWISALPLLSGLIIAGMVRPHVALIAITAGVGALVLHSRSGASGGATGRLVLVGALLGIGGVMSDAAERIFKVEDLNVNSVNAALDLANYRSAQGGSSFVAARIDSVADIPWGVTTVLLRPFPHEATSGPGLVAAVEGIVLTILLLGAIPRLMAAMRSLRREAYLVYAIGFVSVFVFLFSSLGNFGILTRQRTMMTPLVLVLVALPTARERVRARRLGNDG